MRAVWFLHSEAMQIQAGMCSWNKATLSFSFGWYGSWEAGPSGRNPASARPSGRGGVVRCGGGSKYYIHSSLAEHPFVFQTDRTTLRVWYLFASLFIFLHIFRRGSAMAKGEGAEQYSNASLLNKQPSSDDIKLAKKVGSFILFIRRSFICVMVSRWRSRSSEERRLSAGRWRSAWEWMGRTIRQADNLHWAGFFLFKNQFRPHKWPIWVKLKETCSRMR